jgi:hypothetical protein
LLDRDFPDSSGAGWLEEISCNEFFEKFEGSKLAFLHQNETAGAKSDFNKFVRTQDIPAR